MAVTRVLSSKTEDTYTFRYEEVAEGQHGRTYNTSASVHVTLTYPQGTVRVYSYGIKESKSIDVNFRDIKALISILEDCLATDREKKLLPLPPVNQ